MSRSRSVAARYHISGRLLLELIAGGLLVYLLIAGFAGLGRSVQAMQHARPELVAAAGVLVICSYVAATITYQLLAARPIPFWPTFVVQISGCLVNRLLPAGLGGLGINAVYLHRRGHTVPLATTVVASNNALGFVGNMILLGSTIAVSPLTLGMLDVPIVPVWAIALVTVILAAGGIFVMRRQKSYASLRHVLQEIRAYYARLARHPGRSFGALLSSCAVTASHTSALFVLLLALHYSGGWPVALVAISAGAFMGAAIPTPGGLGGAEAGIAAALVAFGAPGPEAVAAALVYRGITYWLPLVPGYVALRIAERRYL